MEKAEAVVLVEYLYWVRDRVLEAAEAVAGEAFTGTQPGASRDLRATLVHELDVEWSWRERLRNGAFPEAEDLDPAAYPDLAAVVDHWRRDEAEMWAWLDGLPDDAMSAP